MDAMTTALPDPATLDTRKGRAQTWFAQLRNDICAAFEALDSLGVRQRCEKADEYGVAPQGFGLLRRRWSDLDDDVRVERRVD